MNLLVVVTGGMFLVLIGTLVGRYFAPDKRPLKRAAREGRAYARGLVEVLDGAPDEAIEHLTKALKSNTKTVEAYFALGTLFRKRGEYERAVRVHQTILVRRDIDKRTRLRTHFQLAADFEAAGFPRRAVKALEWIITKDGKYEQALENLGRLYQSERKWLKAAAVFRKLGKLKGRDTTSVVAHLFCAEALRLMDEGELKAARKLLKRAVSADKTSAHVLHTLALYQHRRGNHRGAVRGWREAMLNRPDFVGYFFPLVEAALFEEKRFGEAGKLLDELLQQYPDNVQVRLVRACFTAKHDSAAALEQLNQLIEEQPRLLPARTQVARLVLEGDDPAALREALESLLTLLKRADHGFRCGECGHTESELFWQCGSCGRWETVAVAWGRRATDAKA